MGACLLLMRRSLTTGAQTERGELILGPAVTPSTAPRRVAASSVDRQQPHARVLELLQRTPAVLGNEVVERAAREGKRGNLREVGLERPERLSRQRGSARWQRAERARFPEDEAVVRGIAAGAGQFDREERAVPAQGNPHQ